MHATGTAHAKTADHRRTGCEYTVDITDHVSVRYVTPNNSPHARTWTHVYRKNVDTRKKPKYLFSSELATNTEKVQVGHYLVPQKKRDRPTHKKRPAAPQPVKTPVFFSVGPTGPRAEHFPNSISRGPDENPPRTYTRIIPYTRITYLSDT